MDHTTHRKAAPELISRPRLNTLFSQGMLSPLILVVAGTGYGKTCAVEEFIQKADARIIRLCATNISNYPERFWRTLKESMTRAIPSLSQKLRNLSFPRTYQEQDHFLHIFSEAVYAGKQVLFVLDDMQAIQNEDIQNFIRALLEGDLENFCMIALSNNKNHLYLRPRMYGKVPFRITAEELCYTRDEIRQRLEQGGITASDAVIASAQKATGGWPLAMHVLVNHWKDHQNLMQQKPFSIEEFMSLFYGDFFTRYSQGTQLMLIKLSLLPMFSLEILSEIGGCNLHEIIEVIRTNPFIITNRANGTLSFQVVYQNFLSKCFLIEAEEQQRIHRIAATHYRKNGFYQESILSYSAAQAYGEAFDVMRNHPYEKLSHNMALFYQEVLTGFPEAYVAENPLVRIFEALLQKILRNTAEAKSLLESVITRYQDVPEIAGEAYLLMGELLSEEDIHKAPAYYELASKCLPKGSMLKLPKSLYVVNRSLIKLYGTNPGDLQKGFDSLKKIVALSPALYRRTSETWYHLMLAEAAYYQMDLESATELANKSVYLAALSEQHDIQCNAWFLLLRIELMHGNLSGAMELFKKIDTLICDRELSSLFVLRDCIAGWFMIKIRDFGKVPKWLTDTASIDMLEFYPSSERDIILRVFYKTEIGAFAQAKALVDAFLPYCETHQFWTVRLNLLISKAVICSRQSKPDEALLAFREAYELTHANNIYTPFIEAGQPMRTLISMVQAMDNHGIDEDWLAMIYAGASNYAKRIASMSREYQKKKADNSQGQAQFSLSARETEVLKHLAKGLKYDEISDYMGISINGVKKHITSIYSKLGAINRADAIYIAMTAGIIG